MQAITFAKPILAPKVVPFGHNPAANSNTSDSLTRRASRAAQDNFSENWPVHFLSNATVMQRPGSIPPDSAPKNRVISQAIPTAKPKSKLSVHTQLQLKQLSKKCEDALDQLVKSIAEGQKKLRRTIPKSIL